MKVVKTLRTVLMLLAFATTVHANTDSESLPAPSGPYAVGRVSYHFTDATRPEPLAGTAGAKREVMVQVWYPAQPGITTDAATAPYFPGFDEIKSKLSADVISDLFRPAKYTGHLPATHTVENAPIAPGASKFPLLLFSPGWGNPTFLYTAELEDLVSHGYVIAAVDHPYDTAFTRFPDGRVAFFAQTEFDAAMKKPHGLNTYARQRVRVMAQDNRFVLDQILKYANAKSLHAPFFQRIDSEHIGAFGHSIGGLAAARTCQIDTRVKACIDQDSADDRGSPFALTDVSETEKQPFLLFVAGSADVTSPRATNPDDASLRKMKLTRAEYDAIMHKQQANQLEQLRSIPGGSYRVTLYNLPGFVHRSFTDQTLLPPNPHPEESLRNFKIANAFTLAFFDKYLKADTKTILDVGDTIDSRVKLEKFPPH